MRSITSKKNTNKAKQLMLGLILVVVMFISVLGYAFQGKEDDSNKKINYNGFEFIDKNGFWFLNIGNSEFVFKHNPNEVEKIDSQLKYLSYYSGKPLYIFSEDNLEAELEIYRNLQKTALRISPAYLEGEEGNENYPIKTCEDNFIIIKESNNTNIIQNQSCVFIEGPKENLTKIADEFLFKILDIE